MHLHWLLLMTYVEQALTGRGTSVRGVWRVVSTCPFVFIPVWQTHCCGLTQALLHDLRGACRIVNTLSALTVFSAYKMSLK